MKGEERKRERKRQKEKEISIDKERDTGKKIKRETTRQTSNTIAR